MSDKKIIRDSRGLTWKQVGEKRMKNGRVYMIVRLEEEGGELDNGRSPVPQNKWRTPGIVGVLAPLGKVVLVIGTLIVLSKVTSPLLAIVGAIVLYKLMTGSHDQFKGMG